MKCHHLRNSLITVTTKFRFGQSGNMPGPGKMSRKKWSLSSKAMFWASGTLFLLKRNLYCWGHWASGVDLEDTYRIECDFLQVFFSSLLEVSFPSLTSVWSFDSAANLQALKHPLWIQVWLRKIKEEIIL